MPALLLLALAGAVAYALSKSDSKANFLQDSAGQRYNLAQVAPSMPVATAEEAAASLRAKGHQGVQFRAATRGGVAFHYTSFPMPGAMVLALGQQSRLGSFPTTLIAVRAAGSAVPSEFKNA